MTATSKDPQVAEYIERCARGGLSSRRCGPCCLGPGWTRVQVDKPCYTHGGSNVVIFQPFKELCALMFFRGALLRDPDGALKEQSENTRPRCAWSSAPSQMRGARSGPSPRSCRTRSASSRPACQSLSALPRTGALPRGAHHPARRQPCYARRVGVPHPRPSARLATALQRRQAVQDPRGAHRARHAADLGRFRNARLGVVANLHAEQGSRPGSASASALSPREPRAGCFCSSYSLA